MIEFFKKDETMIDFTHCQEEYRKYYDGLNGKKKAISMMIIMQVAQSTSISHQIFLKF